MSMAFSHRERKVALTGGVAQLVERFAGSEEVASSILVSSTIFICFDMSRH
ncbi:hypothetical protein VCHA51O444_10353 [Vibrio chagasii]|nr:hypothetical protein VCHA51O444_10353 [Vibrio chagasii]CAH7333860.1 hypothetical protein VCHA53O474_30165 [Vibrio chagasii]